MKRHTSITLIFALILTLASCGGGTTAPVTTTGNEDSTTEAPETTQGISSELPDVKYDGYEFTFLSSDEVGSLRYSPDLYAEEETGEPLNDAVYKRNRIVEERFGIKIVSREVNKKNVMNDFKTSVTAEDGAYDIVVSRIDEILPAGSAYGAEISTLLYVDIEKPWWDGEVIKETAIGGKAYGLLGDINIVDNRSTWCVLFNKRLADEYKVGNLYETVKSGKWTIDELARTAKLVAHEVNGDGKLDYHDQWGLLSSGSSVGSFLWGGGGSFGRTDSKGGVELTIDSERNLSVLTKLYDLLANRDFVLDVSTVQKENGMTNFEILRSVFNEGRGLYISGIIGYIEYFRDMDDEFGILPVPKYDEEQNDYTHTIQEASGTMFMAPKNAPDLERTSVILEALASASVSTLTPAYYDIMLQRKLTHDDESKEMLDLIFSTRTFDAVYCYNWGKVRTIQNLLPAESNTLASSIASIKTAAQTELDNYIKELN